MADEPAVAIDSNKRTVTLGFNGGKKLSQNYNTTDAHVFVSITEQYSKIEEVPQILANLTVLAQDAYWAAYENHPQILREKSKQAQVQAQEETKDETYFEQ